MKRPDAKLNYAIQRKFVRRLSFTSGRFARGTVITALIVVAFLIQPGMAIAQNLQSSGSEAASELRRAADFLRSGQLEEAEPILRRVLASHPDNADAHNLLGVVLDQRNNSAEAEREFLISLRLNPNAVSAMANLGVLLARTKREDEAIKRFESVRRLVPNHEQAIINLGLLYSSRKDYERAADLLTQASRLQPRAYDVKYNLGLAFFNLKRFEEAITAFQSAAAISSSAAEPIYFLGVIAFQRNQDETAREYFLRVTTLRPDYADATFMLGEILAKQKRYTEAVGFYEKAVAQDKTKSVYFVRLGGTYLLNFEPLKAFQFFKEATERFPEIAEIKYFFAIAARSLGEYDLAFSEANKALALRETADTNALLGSLLVDRNEYPQAEKYFRKALALNPNHFNSQREMGRILIKQSKFGEALPFLQRAAALMPSAADVHYQLFLTYTRLKRKAEADKEFALFKQLSNEK